MPSISVIVGTYNHLPYLKLCLCSLERQTFRDFEVIIADDGSGPEVGDWLASYRPFFKLTHLWQEDKGFRKCRLLNLAVKKAKADYLVFIDADCIEAKDFLDEHWKNRAPGEFLGGRRVMISQKTAETVTPEMVRKGYFDGITLWGLTQTMAGNTKYFEEAARTLGHIRKNSPFSLLGCNFSIHRPDLLLVNGFDEEYEHRGGGEDTDIAFRLKAAGCVMKSVRYRAVQFHLGHEIPEPKTTSAELFSRKKKKIKGSKDAGRIKSSLEGGKDDR